MEIIYKFVVLCAGAELVFAGSLAYGVEEAAYGMQDVKFESLVNDASYFKNGKSAGEVYVHYKKIDPKGDNCLLWLLTAYALRQRVAIDDFESSDIAKSPRIVVDRLKKMKLLPYEEEVCLKDVVDEVVNAAERASADGSSLSINLRKCFKEISVTPGRRFYLSAKALKYLSSRALELNDGNVAFRVSCSYDLYYRDIDRGNLWLLVAELFGLKDARKSLDAICSSRSKLERIQKGIGNIDFSHWEKQQSLLVAIKKIIGNRKYGTLPDLLKDVHDAFARETNEVEGPTGAGGSDDRK